MHSPSLAHLLPDSATFPEDVFHIAEHSIPALADQYGTPLYIFDLLTIINACKSYKQAFQTHYTLSTTEILYASKAYLSPLIARLMAEQGIGLDIVSGGELQVAQRAHIPMQRVSFHGNNKSVAELRMALELGVGRIVLDNWSEIENLTRLASQSGQQPGVLGTCRPRGTDRYAPLPANGPCRLQIWFPAGQW